MKLTDVKIDSDTGIFYGWKIAFVSLLVTTTGFGVLYSFGVFFKIWIKEWNCSRAFLSGAFSSAFLVYGISSFFMGKLSDRIGPRKTIAYGGLIMGFGSILTAMVNEAWVLYITFGLMIGIGVGTSYAPTVSTVSRWFIEKKGIAVGIVVAGLGAGSLVYSPLARTFITLTDWRSTFIFFGIIIWIVYFSTAWTIRRHPFDLGMKPYGMLNLKKADPYIGNMTKHPKSKQGDSGISTLYALKKPVFWNLFFVHCLWVVGMTIPMVHLVPYATDRGIPPEHAATMLALVGGFSIAGRLTLGQIAEKMGMKNALLLLLFMQSIAMVWLAAGKVNWMLWGFSFFFGMTYGGLASIFPLITEQYFGLIELGSIFGLILLGATLGGVTGPIVAGYLFDLTQSYNYGIYFGAGSMAVGVFLSLLLPTNTSQTASTLFP